MGLEQVQEDTRAALTIAEETTKCSVVVHDFALSLHERCTASFVRAGRPALVLNACCVPLNGPHGAEFTRLTASSNRMIYSRSPGLHNVGAAGESYGRNIIRLQDENIGHA